MCDKTVQSFSAQSGTNLHTLLLGSIPGVASLTQQQYYAHPRNAFWPIILSFVLKQPASFELAATYSYEQKLKTVLNAGFGLWDVLARCDRPGSLDASIVSSSVTANDIVGLAKTCPHLQHIIFNGKAAQKYFAKHQNEKLLAYQEVSGRTFICTALASTSPAMASLSLDKKSMQWHEALRKTTH